MDSGLGGKNQRIVSGLSRQTPGMSAAWPLTPEVTG
jgi:hypothetical protein